MSLVNQKRWTELAYVDIQKKGEDDVHVFGALTDSIDFDMGNRPIDTTALVNGGRIVTYTPEEDTTITLELFVVGAKANNTDTPHGLANWFYGDESGSSHSTGDGTYYINKHSRYEFRVTVLWTSSYPFTTAPSQTVTEADSFRVSFWGCYLTSLNMSFTDDILTATAEFTCPPYTRNGEGKIAFEEVEDDNLPAMEDFSSSNEVPAWS